MATGDLTTPGAADLRNACHDLGAGRVMIPRDTTAAAHAVQAAIWRRKTGTERVALAVRMSEDARSVTRAGISARHPAYAAAEVQWAFLRLTYGDALFARACPAAPRLEP